MAIKIRGITVLGYGSTDIDSSNIAVGAKALESINANGLCNTAVGAGAGTTITTGSNNVLVGYNAQVSSATASNEVVIGNDSSSRIRIPGLGLDTNNAISGQVLCWNGSQFFFDSASVDIPAGIDSATVIALVDSGVTVAINALVDGAPDALNTLNELAAALNDDSVAYDTLVSLINSRLDSSGVADIVDSAYVRARQDYSYNSLTNTPFILDSNNVISLIEDIGLDSADVVGIVDSAYIQARQAISTFDSSNVIEIVDSEYVQARQDFAYGSLTGTPNVLDSTDVQTIVGTLEVGLDSADVINIVDSDYVQLRQTPQDFAYSSLTGTPNVLDSDDIINFIDSDYIQNRVVITVTGLDSADVIEIVDSAYVQARQDFAYGSLTGVPNVLDSADVQAIVGSTETGLDSAAVIDLIDSAYINDRITIEAGTDSNTVVGIINDTVDSAYVQARVTLDGVGIDSATASALIDSALGEFTVTTIDSNDVIGIVDSAYVQARQDFAYSSLTGAPNVLDSTDVSTIVVSTVDSAYIQARQLSAFGGPDSSTVTGWIDSAIGALVDGAPDALNTLNELAAALNDDSNFASDVLNLIGTKIDSADVLTIVDSAYIQARQVDIFRDSGFVTGIIDSAYVQSRVTLDGVGIDSATASSLIDSALAEFTAGLDSAQVTTIVTNIIDSEIGQDFNTYIEAYFDSATLSLNYDSFNGDGATTNFTLSKAVDQDFVFVTINGLIQRPTLDYTTSGTTLSLNFTPAEGNVINARSINAIVAGGLDSATASSLIDSALAEFNAGIDSAAIISLIDSAYVQARQLSGLDSATVTGWIDSAINALIDGAPDALDTLNELAAALNDDSNFAADVIALIGTKLDSANVLQLVDSAYIQARQVDIFRDSGFVTGIIDSAYIQARVPAGTDSSAVINIINETVDSAYIQARQADIFRDSGFVTGIIDSAYIQSRVTLDGVGIDSAVASSLIDSALGEFTAGLDSAQVTTIVTNIIDSEIGQDFNTYIETYFDSATLSLNYDSFNGDGATTNFTLSKAANQDFVFVTINGLIQRPTLDYTVSGATLSLNFTPAEGNVINARSINAIVAGGLDSATASSLIDSALNNFTAGLDSGNVISLIDSAYIQARQVDIFRDSGFVTGIIDSAYVQSRQLSAQDGLDSATVTGWIDSAISALIDGAPDALNTLNELAAALNDDSNFAADVIALIGTKLDSAGVIGIIDSDYINSRVPAGMDSNTVVSIITETVDSAYVQSRVTLDGVGIDSATASSLIDSALAGFTAGLDSSQVTVIATNIIDSAVGQDFNTYIEAYFDSATLSLNYDSFNGDGATTNFTLSKAADQDFIFVTINGLIQRPVLDYTVSGTTLSLNFAPAEANVINARSINAIVSGGVDSAVVFGLIDSAYIQARQLTNGTGIDSASVVSLIDSAIGALVDGAPDALNTLNELAAALNDDSNFAADVLTLIAEKLDSADVLQLIDSDYINSRVPAGTDSAAVISIVTETVDSAYIQARQVDIFRDSGFVTGIIDSAYIQARVTLDGVGIDSATASTLIDSALAEFTAGLDSAQVTSIVVDVIDSAVGQDFNTYIETYFDSATLSLNYDSFNGDGATTDFTLSKAANQDFIFVTINGLIQRPALDYTVSGSTLSLAFAPDEDNVINARSINAIVSGGLDSDVVLDLIDSAYVQARQVDIFRDSGFITGIVDSAYISSRVAAGTDSNTVINIVTNTVDSAYIQARQVDIFRDSGFVTGIVDSNYIQSRVTLDGVGIDSATASALIDSALANFTTGLDSAQVALIAADVIDSAVGQDFNTYIEAYFDSATLSLNYDSFNGDGATTNFTLSKAADQDFVFVTINGLIQRPVLDYTVSGTTLSLNFAPAEDNVINARSINAIVSGGLDSAYVVGVVDSAVSVLGFLDSAATISLIDSAYIQARQLIGGTGGLDSSTVTGWIDSAIGALVDGAPDALNTLNELAAALNDDSNFATDVLALIGTKLDSADVLQLIDSDYIQSRVPAGTDSNTVVSIITETVDSAYIQARQVDIFRDSGFITGIIDSAYVQARVTLDGVGIDSATASNLIDSALAGFTSGLDSNDVIGIIDSAYVAARTPAASVDSAQLAPIVAQLIDSASDPIIWSYDSFTADGFLDSYSLTEDGATFATFVTINGLVQTPAADYTISGRTLVFTELPDSGDVIGVRSVSGYYKDLGSIDSFDVIGFIDSAYIQARQLTGGGGVDSATVSSLIDSALAGFTGGIDSATVLGLIDSAYIQARQVDIFRDSAFITDIIDSNYIQARQLTGGAGGVDSATVTGWIDSAISALVDGAPDALNTLNELAQALNDDSNFATDVLALIGTKLDSADVLQLIDSDYINSRVPAGTDSNTVVSIITETVDSAYVQARVTLDGVGIDSATASSLIDSALAEFTSGIDSATVLGLIDSAYIQARQVDIFRDSGFITDIVDSAYIQARQVDIFRDSGFITDIVDSAYINDRVSAAGGIDSAAVLNLIDSDYILQRVKPGIDSAAATNIIYDLVDSDYISAVVTLNSVIDINYDSYYADGNTLSFDIGESAETGNLLVTINGIVQRPYIDYNLDSSILTFTSYPDSSSTVSTRVITGINAGDRRVVTLTGTNPDVNFYRAAMYRHTITGNTTYTFSGFPDSDRLGNIALVITNEASYSITWDSAVVWDNGFAPLSPDSGQTDTYSFFTYDKGQTIYGYRSGENMS